MTDLEQNTTPTALLPNQTTDPNRPPLVLVDGSYYLFRTFHALPVSMQNAQGMPTNAIKGTLNAIKKLINRYQPTHMLVAFDTKAPTFRHDMSPIYKGDRPPMPPELAEQIPYVHRLIETLGIPLLALDGFEADDIIGTLAHRACVAGERVIISTGDKDMCQLVNGQILVENSFDETVLDREGVLAKFGVAPEQIVDYLTLMGDSSDGIAGVGGVGKVTAQKLLSQYQTIDGILANLAELKPKQRTTFEASRDSIARDKILATIRTDIEGLPDWEDLRLPTDPAHNLEQLRALYTELDFKQELKSLDHPNHPANQRSMTLADDGQSPSPNKPQPAAPVVQKTYHTVRTREAFDELLTRLKNAPFFAVDTETSALDWQRAQLVGVSLAVQAHEAFYIPVAHVDELGQPLSDQLARDVVLRALKPLLEDPTIGKIGQHLKYDAHIFKRYGIDLNVSPANWQMDTMLASYAINPTATRHNMDDLARHYLGVTTTTFEDVAGKGAKQLTFDQVDLTAASDYACEDADVTWQLFDTFSQKLADDDNASRLLNHIEIPVAQILCAMEHTGVLIDKAFLHRLSDEFDTQIQALEAQAHAQAGEAFNLASPKQLGEILFGKLGLSGGKKTKTGQYSTNEATLATLDHPLVETVLEYRALAKLKSTYTDALANAADAHDRVHTSYHQALTSTGRLSSSEPNLQNIPIRTDTGRLIRQAFIAPPSRVVMSADYSQIELRLMAHFAQDSVLMGAFQQGHDIHRATAADVLAKPLAEVSSEERRRAKAINFGLLYGMSAFGLAKQLGVAPPEAQAYIDAYFARYPTVQDYMQKTREQAATQGYVETLLGRKLYTPDMHHANRNVRNAAERAAINAPLQGSAADIIKLAMIAVQDALKAADLHDHATLLLQVHDELVFEVEQDQVAQVREVVQRAMQNVLTDTAPKLGWVVDFAVPLVVEVGVGHNWDEAH